MLQLCPNGARTRAQHENLPVTPDELADSVRRAAREGVAEVHLHPKDALGADTLEPAAVAAALEAVRAEAPGIPVGVTTGAWVEPDPRRRAELVRSWSVLPDYASVNWHEPGAELVAEALLERGVGVEAGIFTGTSAGTAGPEFLASPLCRRVLAEVTEPTPSSARTAAARLVGQLAGLPVLLHGTDGGMARAADGGRPRAGHPDRAGGRAAVAGRVHRYGQPGSRSGGPRVRRPLID